MIGPLLLGDLGDRQGVLHSRNACSYHISEAGHSKKKVLG